MRRRDLLLAAGSTYAVSTTTSNGSVDTSIRTDPAAGRSISAATSNGRVSISYR